MEISSVEWLVEQLWETPRDKDDWNALLEQSKEMERQKAHEYAEFAIRCDRIGMKILNFEDWIKLQTFKSK